MYQWREHDSQELNIADIIERFATLVPPEGLLTISPSQLKLVSFVEASQSYSCVTYKKPQTQPM
ncbi:hypothetical protein HanXRQr2_Chr15g0688371 [Helianthus annuus]|uniref:Uncharacterized protein n=1 Tax=Helianthus annuus TaxID=4232 RepID=A0A9K3H447_HELAN|nr:hypothetical protein HanXRQr2_Chr15g0688371 [Helianthus annuus]